ncbi:MAG: ATP-binding protein [Amaricoccus sp.]|uniref:ATP-binding protein n=1 Tax=Amaricoccus sp. TaxID=1872485 RepID=UPI0039E47007
MASSSPRRLLPRSLFGRALTILLVPIVVLQLVVGLVFFQRHYLRVSEQMSRSVAYALAYATTQVDSSATPAEAELRLVSLARPLDLAMRFEPGVEVTPGVQRDFFDFTGPVIVQTLTDALHGPVNVDLSDPRVAVLEVGTRLGMLHVEVPRERLSVANPHQLLVLMILVAIILTVVAVIFLRNQVRPIRALAEASDEFGKGRSVPFRPAGAEEVRRAGAAFLSMRARLERQIEQRTQMLSGVSHDLRTPLTRMKLTLALMDETDETRDLGEDVDQMERMLAEFLAFARGDGLETTAPADPAALAARVADAARRAGTRIRLEATEVPAGTLVPMRAGAVDRALTNLVGNAARHGREVLVTVRLAPRTLSFVVEDDGPGIAEADRGRALQPFARLDEARTPSGGNVGLGLSIALDVARSHGGTLELGDSSELGGLRATLRLPR